jgi:hypothetical protein
MAAILRSDDHSHKDGARAAVTDDDTSDLDSVSSDVERELVKEIFGR